ncbi:MAG TPA: hypothetical protein VFN08_00090 [Gemmatimonadales bacterium]|nr:hypothetical protein [Gemmatimonadales bacterium]
MSKTKPRAGEMALEAQARILARFHFALVPSGVPFLGKAQHRLQEEVYRSRQELETALEGLQSTNEKLEAANEELQNSNEEAHERGDQLGELNSFLNLDIGLPVEQLRTPIRSCLAAKTEFLDLTLDATNRRGRASRCGAPVPH